MIRSNCAVCGVSIKSPPSMPKKTCSMSCRDKHKRAAKYDDERQVKLCARCGEWRPYSEYAKPTGSKTGRNGLSSYCRGCSTKISAEWTEKNKRRRKEINDKCREKNAKRLLEKSRNLSEAERERKNALRREWGKRNREKTRMWNKLRVHRQRAAGDMPDKDYFGWLLCSQDAKCVYCGELLERRHHIDHKTPVSRGGTNAVDNLQLTCPSCNMKKGAKTHKEYSRLIEAHRDS